MSTVDTVFGGVSAFTSVAAVTYQIVDNRRRSHIDAAMVRRQATTPMFDQPTPRQAESVPAAGTAPDHERMQRVVRRVRWLIIALTPLTVAGIALIAQFSRPTEGSLFTLLGAFLVAAALAAFQSLLSAQIGRGRNWARAAMVVMVAGQALVCSFGGIVYTISGPTSALGDGGIAPGAGAATLGVVWLATGGVSVALTTTLAAPRTRTYFRNIDRLRRSHTDSRPMQPTPPKAPLPASQERDGHRQFASGLPESSDPAQRPPSSTRAPFPDSPTAHTGGGYAEVIAWSANKRLVVWGDNTCGQAEVPDGLLDVIAIAAGSMHSLALHRDGRITAWGDNRFGQAEVPGGLRDVIAVAAGSRHNLALHRDGRITAWGDNRYGQGEVPDGLGHVVAIAAGFAHNLALHGDGHVTTWGSSHDCRVPARITDAIAIAAGTDHSLVLHRDGRVSDWGDIGGRRMPARLTEVTAVAAGDDYSLALHRDGQITAWGQTYGPGSRSVPARITDVIAIAAQSSYSLALHRDGHVTAWGHRGSVPRGLTEVRAIAAGGTHKLAIVQS